MQLTWHNCETYPPKENRNNTLYATDGSYVFDVIYDVNDGWFDLAAHNYIPKDVLNKFWWADLNQTVQKTHEFMEVVE
jgi:hypothetical protein